MIKIGAETRYKISIGMIVNIRGGGALNVEVIGMLDGNFFGEP